MTPAVSPVDVDEMLLREFRVAAFNNASEDVRRRSRRAVDKVLAEFKLLGFVGFRVREHEGELIIEGIAASELFEVPAYLRQVPP